MSEREDRLIDLASALADGNAIDWDAAESHAATDSERLQIQRMRLVHDVARSPAGSSAGPEEAGLHESLLHPTDSSHDDAGNGHAPVTWGPLRVIEKIGRGRFGDVYRAFDPRLEREVALKLLRHRDTRTDDLESTVIEEGRLLAKVRHPNVVTVYGAERIDDRVGVWMELVQGRTLEEELQARGPLPPEEVAAIGVDISRALAAVHRAGLVHRDIKAQNVMRDSDGRLILMDFGTGRELEGASPPELAGTPLYLAPEIFEGKPATPASDIYGVGVVLYHLATGQFPISGRTLREIRDAHQHQDLATNEGTFAAVPASLSPTIRQALEHDAENRFAVATALELALVASQPTARTPKQRWWQTRTARLAVVAAVALTLMTAAAVTNGWISAFTSQSNAPTLLCVQCGNDEMSVALDGKTAVAADEETGDLKIGDVLTGKWRRLLVKSGGWKDSDEAASFPKVSRDGKSVAYTWLNKDGNVELRVVDSRGGTPHAIPARFGDDLPTPTTWSADGKDVLIHLRGGGRTKKLAWVSVEDGRVRVIKDLQSRVTNSADRPAVSPDGRFIAYSALVTNPPRIPSNRPTFGEKHIYVLSSDGKSEFELTKYAGISQSAAWAADGRAVLYVSNVLGTFDLWSQPVKEGQPLGSPVLVHKDIGDTNPVGVSRSGTYLYYQWHDGVHYSTIARLATESQTAATLESFPGNIPTWSPDGRAIAVIRPRPGDLDGNRDLVVHELNGGERTYHHDKIEGYPTLWFQHEPALLKAADEMSTGQNFFRVDLQTGEFRKLAPHRGDPHNLTHWNIKALSPDGKTLYFGTYVKKDDPLDRIVALDFATGKYRTIFRLPGEMDSYPRAAQEFAIAINRSGDRLALMRYDPKLGLVRLATVGTDGSGYRELCSPFKNFDLRNKLAWAGDDQSILFAVGDPDTRKFKVMRISTSGGEPVFTGVEVENLETFDVSPDGTRIVYSILPQIGWRAELWALELPNR